MVRFCSVANEYLFIPPIVKLCAPNSYQTALLEMMPTSLLRAQRIRTDTMLQRVKSIPCSGMRARRRYSGRVCCLHLLCFPEEDLMFDAVLITHI